jgi:hypothetical protein
MTQISKVEQDRQRLSHGEQFLDNRFAVKEPCWATRQPRATINLPTVYID